MSKPQSKHEWVVVLTAIEWLQRHFDELVKADADVQRWGSGFIKITEEGIKHVPYEEIASTPPPVD